MNLLDLLIELERLMNAIRDTSNDNLERRWPAIHATCCALVDQIGPHVDRLTEEMPNDYRFPDESDDDPPNNN